MEYNISTLVANSVLDDNYMRPPPGLHKITSYIPQYQQQQQHHIQPQVPHEHIQRQVPQYQQHIQSQVPQYQHVLQPHVPQYQHVLQPQVPPYQQQIQPRYQSLEPRYQQIDTRVNPPQINFQTSYDMPTLLQMKNKLITDLRKINDLINEMKNKDKLIIEPTTPSKDFIDAVYTVLSKEIKPIIITVLHNKLPKTVLPPSGLRGVFKTLIDQVPNIQKKVENIRDKIGNIKKEYFYWLDETTSDRTSPDINITKPSLTPVVEVTTPLLDDGTKVMLVDSPVSKNKKVYKKKCFRKAQGKPCKLNENGVCDYC